MTYQDLLNDLETAECYTPPMEKFVAEKWQRQISQGWMDAEYIAKYEDEDKIDFASWFISDMVVASWKSVEAEDGPCWSGTQNAYDTLEDYGLSFDSLVGQFKFACFNHPNEEYEA